VQSRHVTNAGFDLIGCARRNSLAEIAISAFSGIGVLCIRQSPEEALLAKEPIVPKDIASLSFEDALKELEGIVQQLERGQVKLDEAISAYERGALLKRHCEQKLAEAKMKVEKIVFSADGTVSSQPADLS
jgi:exodeoxyribonuclease VII small subunit